MSFLNSIQAKKSSLKATDTCVTYVDGRKYKETRDSKVEILGIQYGFVIDRAPDNIPAEIIDHLYLGSQDCCDEEVLRRYNIKYVLSIGIEVPAKYPQITYKFVNCLDVPETELQISLRECIPFIQQAKTQSCNILVHCNAGVSRSASVIIGYLILVEDYSYIDAYNIVKNARNCIKPNTGFEKQLQYLSSNKRNFF